MNKLLALMSGLLACSLAVAQVPVGTSPVTVLVGGPPGTPGDVLARAISGPLGTALGRPVVVENRPGAAGTVAMAAVARARPDGDTPGIFGLQAAVAPQMMRSVPYDTRKDLLPVRQLSTVSNVLLVRAGGVASTAGELVQLARERSLSYASGGNGTPAHLVGELFRQELGLRLQHVPFNGPVAGVTALAGGHVDLMFATAPAALPLVQAGKVTPLAVTGAQRLPLLPALQTVTELGWPSATVVDWHGVVAPAGMAPERAAQLAAAIDEVLAQPAVQQRLLASGLEPAAVSGPAAFRQFLDSEISRWAGVLQRAGVGPQ